MYEEGASKTNIEARTIELYEFVQPSFMGGVVRADQVTPFPWDKADLRELWKNNGEPGTPFRIIVKCEEERDPVIKRMWRIIRERKWKSGPGIWLDNISNLKQYNKVPLTKCLINTIRVQIKLGLIYPAYKLGFISYILKLGAPNTRAQT